MPKLPLIDSQTKALWEVGFWKPADFAVIAIELFAVMTMGFWWVFGTPFALGILCVLVSMLILLVAWGILLIYRCMYFVVQARADINLMPATAAKLALMYQNKMAAE